MEKIKTIVDREPVSSDYIEAKQDFGQVLSQVKNLKPPVWKTAWFYGPVGMAVVAVIISATTINPTTERPTENASVTVQDKLIEQLNQPESITTVQVASVHESTDYHSENPMPSQVKHPVTTTQERANNESSSQPVVEEPEELTSTVLPVEEETQPEVAVKKKNMFPHIEGYFNGDIPVSILSSEKGIQLNEDIKVVAFDIHYESLNGTETAAIVGNTIPKQVIDKIKRYNMGYMVFITDIKGVDRNGKVLSLPSMNFIATNSK